MFVSYAQDEDAARALDLANRLETAGISVWIADRAIAWAENYGPEVVEAIERCRVLAVLCSYGFMPICLSRHPPDDLLGDVCRLASGSATAC